MNYSNRFVAALFQESPVIVDIEGNDIIKTVLPTEPEDKDESIKAYGIWNLILHREWKYIDTRYFIDHHFL